MVQKIKYRGTTSTKEEAEAMALSFLRQVVEVGDSFQTSRVQRTDSDTWSVILLPSGVEAPEEPTSREAYIPTAYVTRQKQETPEEEGRYRVYLLFDKDRLPFLYRSVTDTNHTQRGALLTTLEPVVKPVEALPVETILTKEGVDILEEALHSYEMEKPFPYSAIDREVERVRNAPKELRIYSFIDTYGTETPLEDIKELEEEAEDAYDTDVVDGELVLNALTGETFTSEKEYLKALGAFVGKKGAERYKENFLNTYRLCKALRFVDFLEYELLRTEDYGSIQEHYEKYASAIGYKAEYIKRLTHEGEYSALELALAKYLQDYIHFGGFFSGLSEKRLAEYLNIPAETLHRIYTEVIDNSLL